MPATLAGVGLPTIFRRVSIPDETSETWGQGTRVGIVPLTKDRVYWFVCVNASANDPLMRSLDPTDLLAFCGSFHAPIPQLIKRTDKVIWNDIIDIEPINKFAFDKVVLIGDAAHATTPNMGQGACMAIEDAVVLTNCIVRRCNGRGGLQDVRNRNEFGALRRS